MSTPRRGGGPVQVVPPRSPCAVTWEDARREVPCFSLASEKFHFLFAFVSIGPGGLIYPGELVPSYSPLWTTTGHPWWGWGLMCSCPDIWLNPAGQENPNSPTCAEPICGTFWFWPDVGMGMQRMQSFYRMPRMARWICHLCFADFMKGGAYKTIPWYLLSFWILLPI